jgi:hypothetical protein
MDANATPEDVLTQTLEGIAAQVVDSTSVLGASDYLVWLSGGPLTPELAKSAPNDAAIIHTLATTLAAISQFGDEAFWDTYRERLLRAPRLDLRFFFSYFIDPRHQVRMVLRPRH